MNTIIENNTIVANNLVDLEPIRARATSAQASLAMYQRVEALAIEREVWQTGEYARSNDTLYGLIGKCKALHQELVTKADDTVAKRAGFDDFLNIKGLTFKSSTELTYKVIRAVFGDQDRRRLSTYHTVLRVAIKNGWTVGEIPARIAEFGGVQEISLGSASGQMTAKQKAEVAKSAVNGEVIATLKSEVLSQAFDPNHIGQKAVAVLTQQADGSFSVHAVVHNNTAVTAALAAFYSANKAGLKTVADQKAVADAQMQRDEAIDAAAKSVVNG
jgi:hypothetical protein